MELRHLRYFVVLAEELHFGRAAERLGISQPPLSLQIRLLEEELAARLFERTSRRVKLTQAGQLFLDEARAALDQVARARRVAARAHLGELGELVMGLFPSGPLIEPVARAMLSFRQHHPGVRLMLRERATHLALEDMAEGRLEVCFMRYPGQLPLPPGVTALEIAREPMVVLMPRDHPLATLEGPVPLAALAREPMVHFSPGIGNLLHAHVFALCANAGFEPRIEQEANQNGTIVALVAAGLGITILPRSICRLGLPELCVRRISDAGALSHIWLAHRGTSPLVKHMIARTEQAIGAVGASAEPDDDGVMAS